MNITSFINFLYANEIQVEVKSSKLHIHAPKGAVTQQLKEQIKERKQELIDYLEAVKPKAPINRADRSLPLPLSYAQQRLWLLCQIDGTSAHYNVPEALKLNGTLDVEALDSAFSTIIQRHESLRTSFVLDEEGQPRQHIKSDQPFTLIKHDLSSLDEQSCSTKLVELLELESLSEFDLSTDLMLRARLIKLADQQHILLVTMHHIASDGWSMAILIDEFSQLYSSAVLGKNNPLPEQEIQYADYAIWQKEYLSGQMFSSLMDYWQKQLKHLPSSHMLPLDHPRPKQQSFAGSILISTIDSADTEAMNEFCMARGATLFMGINSVFALLLSRYSNETDIVVGTPVANREQPQLANLIGFFVNTLVLRTDLSGEPDFEALLERSKVMLFDA